MGTMNQTIPHKNHIERLKRIEILVRHLGLTCRKSSEQVRAISVSQGSYGLYSDWSTRGGDDTTIEMNKNLEKFLLRYKEYLEAMPGMILNSDCDVELEKAGYFKPHEKRISLNHPDPGPFLTQVQTEDDQHDTPEP